MQFSNPFDNPQGQFYILRNDQQQYSLWPAHCDLPAGWAVVCPPQSPRPATPGWRPTGQP
ncbi:cytoplasmic protein YbdZ [Klebsiella variicola]|nr:cytoplasmic protein YbdZ [Klebsiella variicola]